MQGCLWHAQGKILNFSAGLARLGESDPSCHKQISPDNFNGDKITEICRNQGKLSWRESETIRRKSLWRAGRRAVQICHEHGGSDLYLWKVCTSQMPECCMGEKLLVGCIISRKFHADKKTAELLWSFFGAGIGPLRGLWCLPSHLVRCAFKTGQCPSAPIGLGVRADLRKLLGMVQKS